MAADVGCDHGRLSVALAAQGKCRKIIASDIRPAPLATAQRLVTLHGCGDVVECRLGAGLSVLRPGEADDIVIAGVSGVTVCEMLEQAPEAFYAAKPDMRFIFIPATKHPFLRRWLAQHGFALLDETPVFGRRTVLYRDAHGLILAEQRRPILCGASWAVPGADRMRQAILPGRPCFLKRRRGEPRRRNQNGCWRLPPRWRRLRIHAKPDRACVLSGKHRPGADCGELGQRGRFGALRAGGDGRAVRAGHHPRHGAGSACCGVQCNCFAPPGHISPFEGASQDDVPALLVREGVSAVCMHTNLDKAQGGVNDVLAQALGLRDTEPFAGGIGRVGVLPETMEAAAFAQFVGKAGCPRP